MPNARWTAFCHVSFSFRISAHFNYISGNTQLLQIVPWNLHLHGAEILIEQGMWARSAFKISTEGILYFGD